jgi:hypothetical protein
MKLLLENWRRFLKEQNGGAYRVYHGAEDAAFPEFQLRSEKTTDPGWFGDGLYFDTSMRQAISYAGGSRMAEENVETIENALKGNKANIIPTSGAIRIINKTAAPNAGVFVLDLQIKSLYEWKGAGIPSIVQNPYLNKMPEDIAAAIAQKMQYSSWEELVKAMESPNSADESEWQKWIARSATLAVTDLGHDGVRMTRSNGGAEYVIFDVNSIKNVLK